MKEAKQYYEVVSVKDELPDFNVDTFALSQDDDWQSMCYYAKTKQWYNTWDNDEDLTECFPSHWLRPTSGILLSTSEYEGLMADKTHHEALVECCTKLLDKIQSGDSPARYVTGLKILLNK